ncbi:DUF3289 family protein [Haliangium sp.]|uniref:DUF3289 family protein n=1 Tax=Haliangium sp. TaxID=2663208 RepID=UPI003D133C3F
MGQERWFRGEQEGRRRPYDWQTPALKRDIPLERARALYEEARRSARRHRDPERYVEQTYLDLLQQIQRSPRAPSPGKVTRTMRLTAERSGTRPPRRSLSPLTGLPIAPGKRPLTSYLAREPARDEVTDDHDEWMQRQAEVFQSAGLPLPTALREALTRGQRTGPETDQFPDSADIPQPPEASLERSMASASSPDGQAPTPTDGGVDATIAGPVDATYPLPQTTRERMERAFGQPLDHVAVYPESPLARGQTEALARGREIHFRAGAYAPGTPQGDWLLAHELAHVVQQTRSDGESGPRRALEADADRSADAVLAGQPARVHMQAEFGATYAHQEEQQPESSYPYIGLINTQGTGFHKEARPARSNAVDYIRPDFDRGDRVVVLGKTAHGWLHVTRVKGGKQETGYVDWRYVDPLPFRIATSGRRPGLGYDGTSPADDLAHRDYSEEEVEELSSLFKITNSFSDEALFAQFRFMATTLFSVGKLETNILQMIDKFQRNDGTPYSSPILDKAVSEHASTNRFLGDIATAFRDKINAHRGDALALKGEDLRLVGNPRFNTFGDTWRGGLTIAVNDVWAYDVDLTDYKREGDHYSATIHLTLYDHFGLDRPDMEKKYKYLAGFRAWFVLQHVRGYRPFTVEIGLDHTFSGKIEPAPE